MVQDAEYCPRERRKERRLGLELAHGAAGVLGDEDITGGTLCVAGGMKVQIMVVEDVKESGSCSV